MKLLPKAVNSSGAVSPARRASASNTPVRMPENAARISTCNVSFHWGMPSERAASRNVPGTSCNISSVVRTITGRPINASATLPANPENEMLPLVMLEIGSTMITYTNKPSTIEGADSRMSLRKRIDAPSLLELAYSARYVPANMPIGAQISSAIRSMIKLPTMALERPPSSAYAVIFVNSESFSALKPFSAVIQRIQTRKTRPIKVATPLNVSAMTLVMRRRA